MPDGVVYFEPHTLLSRRSPEDLRSTPSLSHFNVLLDFELACSSSLLQSSWIVEDIIWYHVGLIGSKTHGRGIRRCNYCMSRLAYWSLSLRHSAIPSWN